jgi:hypothetical protein
VTLWAAAAVVEIEIRHLHQLVREQVVKVVLAVVVREVLHLMVLRVLNLAPVAVGAEAMAHSMRTRTTLQMAAPVTKASLRSCSPST